MNEVVLRDLQAVLRQQLGDELLVENFSTKLFLPPGENYGSTMLSVVASIKKNKNAEAETLHLVAKMLPPTNFQRKIFDSGFTFRKETFFYTDILPFYKQLEMEFGVEESEVFDIGAKFYGSRFSSNSEVDIDDDAVILLEDLKVKGYYTGNRRLGLDLEHAKLAIRALAKVHALGMAAKYKRPNEFEALKVRCKCLKLNPEAFEGMKDSLVNDFRTNPVISKYFAKCEPLLKINPDGWISIPPEPWSTIIHTDFWVNNIMFHKSSNGKVDDVKFVDFQNYLFQNPINELIFFISVSVATDLISENLDNLLDLYYKTFMSVLKRMDCDITLFSRDNFDERLKKDVNKEFTHCAFMMRMMTIDVEKDGFDIVKLNNMEFQTSNDMFFDRMGKIIALFIEREWI